MLVQQPFDASKVDKLTSVLRGRLLLPGEDDYERSRTIFNAMIDRHPALIVRCTGVGDVIAAINFARDNELPLSVKGAGHNVAGNAICDDGLVIDFSSMKSIRVDPRRRVARVEPGSRGESSTTSPKSSASPLPAD